MSKLILSILVFSAIVYYGMAAGKLRERSHLDDDDDGGPCKFICFFKTSITMFMKWYQNRGLIDDPCAQQISAPLSCGASMEALSNIDVLIENDMDIGENEINLFNTSINILCSDCLGVYQEYYTCTGNLDELNYLKDGMCAQNNGGYCPTQLFEAQYIMNITEGDCNITDTHSCGNCHDYLNQLNDTLGCCASSLFRTTASNSRLTDEKFTVCELTLGERCEVPSSAMTVAMTNMILILSVLIIALYC